MATAPPAHSKDSEGRSTLSRSRARELLQDEQARRFGAYSEFPVQQVFAARYVAIKSGTFQTPGGGFVRVVTGIDLPPTDGRS